jgi:hypothetical protein
MRRAVALLAPLLLSMAATLAGAEQVPFSAVLEIRASAGQDLYGFPLLSAQATGVAEIEAGVVRLPAGELSALVPGLSGFGGTLVNGPATFSAAGAGPGSSCPLTQVQEVCIGGGGFGGVMALNGVSQEGQALAVWGLGGSSVGSTSSGLSRVEEGTRWTQGTASAWYYVLEVDPGTPFLLSDVGSFRGLPSTFAGEGLPGFSVVTPLVVTADLPTSMKNARAVAKLRIDFGGAPVPIGGVWVLALLLALIGAMRLVFVRSSAPDLARRP